MNFYEFYRLLSENIEQNFDNWLEILIKYTPRYKDYLSYFKQQEQIPNPPGVTETRDHIIEVLKEKNLENFNWFSFCLGYRSVKTFRKEDLKMAIDVTKKAIDSGELPKSEIGAKGWFQIGREAGDRISKYLEKQNELSKREIERRKKRGEAELDEEFVKLIVAEGPFKIYYLPRLQVSVSPSMLRASTVLMTPVLTKEDKNKAIKRHQILCSLGKSTEWCTAQPSWDAHESYILDDIYIIHENEKPKYQFVSCVNSDPDNRQFMDVDDQEVESLETPIFKLLKKYLKKETSCHQLKEFLTSAEDFNNLKYLHNVDFISINRLLTKISGRWLDEIYKRPDWRNFKFESGVKDYEHAAKVAGVEHLRQSEEKALIPVFEKLLNLIDSHMRTDDDMRQVSNIIDIVQQNLNSSGSQSFSFETFNRFKNEIKERKARLNI